MSSTQEFFVDAPMSAWGTAVDACRGDGRTILVEFDSGRIESFGNPFGSTYGPDLVGLDAYAVSRRIHANDDAYLSRPMSYAEDLASRRAEYQAKSRRLGLS